MEALPWGRDREIRVIDLGCGTGTLALRVKERFPKARITCLDLAENMIRLARMKLGRFGNEITYRVGDFYHFQFTTEYDAVVSSLALHHLVTDDDKRRFYAQIYECLSGEGVFFNADVVLGRGERFGVTAPFPSSILCIFASPEGTPRSSGESTTGIL